MALDRLHTVYPRRNLTGKVATIIPMPDAPNNLPGNGFLGWLGRQVGHVKKAVKTDVASPSKIIYRESTIQEKQSPADPNVKYRRTIIDEVVKENDE
jgi:hypothetical protein